MRRITFHSVAFDEYSDWAETNRKTFKKILRMIKLTARNPFEGEGNPEPLKHELAGRW